MEPYQRRNCISGLVDPTIVPSLHCALIHTPAVYMNGGRVEGSGWCFTWGVPGAPPDEVTFGLMGEKEPSSLCAELGTEVSWQKKR